MVEIGVGLLFALCFITIYLLISRFFGSNKRKPLRGAIALAPLDSAKAIGTNRPKLFLTTREISERHSPTEKSPSAENGH